MAQITTGRREAAADAAAQAEVLIGLGRYEHALAAIARGLILAPGDAGLHCQRSVALLRLGRTRAALQAAGDAISADPDDASAHELKAAALVAQARVRVRLWRRQFGLQAQAAAIRAVRLAPQDARCHCTAADAALLAGDWPAARTAAVQAMSLAPTQPEPAVALSQVALAARDYGTARAAAVHALTFDPGNYPALANLGWALVGLARWKQAADTLAEAARIDPRAVPARRRLAQLGGAILGLAVVGALVPLLAMALALGWLAPPWGPVALMMATLTGVTGAGLSSRLQTRLGQAGLAIGLWLARARVPGPVLAAGVVGFGLGGIGLALGATVGLVALPAVAASVGSPLVALGLLALAGKLVRSRRARRARPARGARCAFDLGPSLEAIGPRPLAGARTSLIALAAAVGWGATAVLAPAPGAVLPALLALWWTVALARRVRSSGLDFDNCHTFSSLYTNIAPLTAEEASYGLTSSPLATSVTATSAHLRPTGRMGECGSPTRRWWSWWALRRPGSRPG